MGELIEGVRPDFIMMENVPGLLQRGRVTFEKFLDQLSRLNYQSQWRIVQMTGYGLPQSRKRLVLLAAKRFEVSFPAPTHQQASSTGLKPWKTVREAIGHLAAPITLSETTLTERWRAHNWHVARDLQPQTKQRLRAAVPGRTWRSVDVALRPQCHQGGYVGFTNVYGRMAWDDVSPTITSGCTTACKGRFGHPDKRRYTISVREAAVLQGFSDTYIFESESIDAVCELIGNAVPPLYAKAAGKHILSALRD
jgi:DNA (cytosine-5)-methyltransferase 1